MTQKFPFSIGVGVFVRNRDSILVGKRSKTDLRGADCWALPGGVVEENETIVQAVLREVREETGLDVMLTGGYPVSPLDTHGFYGAPFCIPGLLAVTDHSDIHQQLDGRLLTHLTFWIATAWNGGTPELKEPDKCQGWEWKKPSFLAELPGVNNPTHPQYYWTPMPLWRKILRPYFGEF